MACESLPLRSGHSIPQVGLGTWRMEPEECYTTVLQALKSGYTHIDTASIYANEEDTGRAIADYLKSSGKTRGDLFVTSKAIHDEMGETESYEACLRSLKKLGMDYLDLYLVHLPLLGDGSPPSDTRHRKRRHGSWLALERLYKEGKVRSIGVSNFALKHFVALEADGIDIYPMVNQVEMNPLCSKSIDELADVIKKHQIVIESYSPLRMASEALLTNPTAVEVSKKNSVTVTQVLIRWNVQRGYVPLVRSRDKTRMEQLLDVFSFKLTDEEMKTLDALNEDNYRFLNRHFEHD